MEIYISLSLLFQSRAGGQLGKIIMRGMGDKYFINSNNTTNGKSSVLCMDKSLAYIIAENVGIATPNFWVVRMNGNINADQFSYSFQI